MTGSDDFEALVQIETDDCVEWPGRTSAAGYGMVWRRPRTHYVGRLALERHVGPPPTPKHHAAHGPCHNPRCMDYRHLRWATAKENQADRYRDGTPPVGEGNSRARLTPDKVIKLRELRAAGMTYADLGDYFNVSLQTAHYAATGKTWSHL